MDLTSYVDNLRRDLAVAAEAGGEDARALAERLTAPLESAVRLTLLIGSYATLFWLWRQRKKENSASTPTQ